jgi:ketosteroid isomerase-like protein
MSQENVEIVREAMDAYNLGDKDGWARFMDPGIETFPVPEFPEPGSLIGPDAAWDFYQRFGETMAASKLYETSGFETAELIDAGDRVVACQRTPLHGRGGEVVVAAVGGPHVRSGEMGQNPVVLEQARSPQSRRAVGVAHWTSGGSRRSV